MNQVMDEPEWLGHFRRKVFARAVAMPGVAVASVLDQHLCTAPAAERVSTARSVSRADH
jgi:hypothetical protein